MALCGDAQTMISLKGRPRELPYRRELPRRADKLLIDLPTIYEMNIEYTLHACDFANENT